jgi:hypothetical protein
MDDGMPHLAADRVRTTLLGSEPGLLIPVLELDLG